MQRSRLVDPDSTNAAAPEAGRSARLHWLGVAVSLALHVIAWGVLRIVREPRVERPAAPVLIDLDLAPIAPAAETLPPEEELAARQPEPPAPEEQVPPLPAPAVDPDGVGALDAGVTDAALDAGVDARPVDARAADAAIDARPRDASVDAEAMDAGVDAATVIDVAALEDARDAGPEGDAGGEQLATADAGGDGGAQVASADEDAHGGGDGGTGTGDGGGVATTGDADHSGVVARTSTGTAANLLAYAPRGHVVTLLARMDRVRGTEWADRVEAMLAPLPDHDALIGDQAVRITDAFETLVISSPDPARADATTLVARSRLDAPALRDLLDQPDAAVRWSSAVGGALGRRLPSPRVIPGDARVFLGWKPGWTTLARPADLSGLLAPASTPLDQAAADPARLPSWLASMETIEAESGDPDGPALMLTAASMFPARLELPMIDVAIPGPERATLTLTVDPQGFVVRGSLRYADEGAAATAADAIVRAQRELLGSTLAKIALGSARALNAVRGLSVQRTGSRVAFATSISAGDARVLLARVADLVAAHFDELRDRQSPSGRPSPSTGAPDGGPP